MGLTIKNARSTLVLNLIVLLNFKLKPQISYTPETPTSSNFKIQPQTSIYIFQSTTLNLIFRCHFQSLVCNLNSNINYNCNLNVHLQPL